MKSPGRVPKRFRGTPHVQPCSLCGTHLTVGVKSEPPFLCSPACLRAFDDVPWEIDKRGVMRMHIQAVEA